MNSYKKSNVNLPISLHDASVSAIQVIPVSDGEHNGAVTFTFGNGFVNLFQKDGCQTGRASVKLSGIDFDFSHAYYCKENWRREVGFEELADDLKKNTLTVLDEYYSYNSSKFGGYMTAANVWNEVEIEIFHFAKPYMSGRTDPCEMTCHPAINTKTGGFFLSATDICRIVDGMQPHDYSLRIIPRKIAGDG